MSDIKVRVGQQNAIRVTSSISGGSAFADFANTGTNVIGGIASVSQLNVSGISTFVGLSTFKDSVYISGDLYIGNDLVFDEFRSRNGNITGILTVGTSLYYNPGEPYGVAYFDQNDLLVSTGSTSTAISETNYILSTNSSGVPTWSNTIDGGFY